MLGNENGGVQFDEKLKYGKSVIETFLKGCFHFLFWQISFLVILLKTKRFLV